MNAALRQDVYAPKIDWRQILADLRDHGCTGYRVSTIMGVAWCTVQNWRDNPKAEPGYGHGRALLRLHSRFCGAALTIRRQAEGEHRM